MFAGRLCIDFIRSYLAPHLPPLAPIKRDRWYRYSLIATILLASMYTIIMSFYLIQLHRANGTHAEDMGIMDQVLWNTLHGHFWQQTICNPIGDTNCLGNVSRWAIHFEPSMLLLLPIYAIYPHPQLLQVVQTAGVALGVIPAFLLGARRFQLSFAGFVVAALYLWIPVLRAAVTSDFHMVTFAAPALLFALYCMYTRNNKGFFLAILFALGTKEQIPLDVFMIGLGIGILQSRWRMAAITMAVATGWAILALGIIHIASPLGQSPTAARYSIHSIITHIPLLWQDPMRLDYIRVLNYNAFGLAWLAPWAFILAAPSIVLNALSADPSQYSGIYQYNADIAPFLLLTAIEGGYTIIQGIRWLFLRYQRQTFMPMLSHRVYPALSSFVLILVMTTTSSTLIHRDPSSKAINPNEPTVVWPQITAHTKLASKLFALIPANASVSAQADLVPHLSHRVNMYQFPDHIQTVDYILLDTESDTYPEPSINEYFADVQNLLVSDRFDLVASQDGYILLRALSEPSIQKIILPPEYCPTSQQTNEQQYSEMLLLGSCISLTPEDQSTDISDVMLNGK